MCFITAIHFKIHIENKKEGKKLIQNVGLPLNLHTQADYTDVHVKEVSVSFWFCASFFLYCTMTRRWHAKLDKLVPSMRVSLSRSKDTCWLDDSWPDWHLASSFVRFDIQPYLDKNFSKKKNKSFLYKWQFYTYQKYAQLFFRRKVYFECNQERVVVA